MARFVVWWYRAVQTTFFVFIAVLLLQMGVPTDNLVSRLWSAAFLALTSYAALRSARSASIEFHAHELVVRGLVRTKRIPLSRIRHVGVARGGSMAYLPWRVPSFVLDDGSVVQADEIRSLRTPSIVDDVVTEAHHRLA